ncbi:MAG: 50S ribosomal protein L11 methyltransferase [Deltaproteobacteria bacterium]|nr:50S ribosomal protein L11 methyltransferase [Deltaproteobacteria bacterium]
MSVVTHPTRITVLKPGLRSVPPTPGEMTLAIDRRGTFAPTHPTTRLCLELLTEATRSGRLKGTWLDVGSGSGVLAVACGRLDAERVATCDTDYRAAMATVTNVRANGQERRILTVCGSTEAVRGPFDGIVANLPISVLSAIWNSFTRLLAPEGVLILSGCREPEGEWLASSLAPQGLALRKVVTRHETAIELPPSGSFTWAGLSLERCP